MKKRRAGRIQRLRRNQVVLLRERIDKLKIEQSLVRRTKTLMSKVPAMYRGSIRIIIWFDHLFLEAEPNVVKRRNRLRRIFNLRPIASDKPYIDIMVKEMGKYRKRSRAMAIKNGIISIKQ